jgi:hypothetical protein
MMVVIIISNGDDVDLDDGNERGDDGGDHFQHWR